MTGTELSEFSFSQTLQPIVLSKDVSVMDTLPVLKP